MAAMNELLMRAMQGGVLMPNDPQNAQFRNRYQQGMGGGQPPVMDPQQLMQMMQRGPMANPQQLMQQMQQGPIAGAMASPQAMQQIQSMMRNAGQNPMRNMYMNNMRSMGQGAQNPYMQQMMNMFMPKG